MSLSNPTATNPSTRFMQWRGGSENVGTKDKPEWEGGRLTYYDKEAEEEVEVALPFSFIVLDELNTITGFSEKDNSGFWSNEVRNMTKAEFVVKTKRGTVATGLYANIKDELKAMGAKYTKSVYIAFKNDEGELAIGHIKIAGAALTAWIEFQKKFNVSQCAVMISDTPQQAKKGKNVYFVPVFEGQKLGAATKSAAVALDRELQAYLGAYFSRRPEEEEQYATTAAELDEPVATATDDEDDLPASKSTKAATPKKKAAPIEEPEEDEDDDEEETINLADVPF